MLTLGIDLSSQRDGTVGCLIEWTTSRATVRAPRLRCSDDDLDELISLAQIAGIDAPFGWPAAFANAVANWSLDNWSAQIRDQLRFRETDRDIRARFRITPLSVASDRIALPAMRAMALLNRHHAEDRSGDGRFFEVYPAASLCAWGWSQRGYKDAKNPKCLAAREKLLAQFRTAMPWLEIPDEYAATSDALDSLIASLTARAIAQGFTRKPEPHILAAAKREGWIHVPIQLPTL